jgi:hypothetical protein
VRARASQHAQECGLLRTIEEIAQDTECESELLRVVWDYITRSLSSSSSSSYSDGVLFAGYTALDVLVHHDSTLAENVKEAAEQLHEELPSAEAQQAFPVERIERIMAVVNANAHGIQGDGSQYIGGCSAKCGACSAQCMVGDAWYEVWNEVWVV